MRFFIVTLIIFMFYATNSFCQEPDLYFESLKKHIEETELSGTIYIEYDYYINNEFPSKINSKNISLLNKKEIKGKTRNKRSIHLIRILPVSLENDNLYITIIDFNVSRKGRKYNYGNGGGSKIKLIYDCNANKYIIGEGYKW